MITCFLMGGLGNQLFQIYSTISIALQNKNLIYFKDDNVLTIGKTRNTYWHSLLNELKKYLKLEYHSESILIKEKSFHYNEDFISEIKKHEHLILHGYFQSFKYFDQYSKLLYRILKIEDKKRVLIKKYNLNESELLETVSIHFRMDDYLLIQDYHPILKINYYLNAIEYIHKNDSKIKNAIFFYQKKDYDIVNSYINTIKSSFTNIKFKLVDYNMDDWEEMLYMSMCKNNIIANSTFSWWGAYLNNQDNNIVCYPSIWFGIKGPSITDDLFMDEWVKIKATE